MREKKNQTKKKKQQGFFSSHNIRVKTASDPDALGMPKIATQECLPNSVFLTKRKPYSRHI